MSPTATIRVPRAIYRGPYDLRYPSACRSAYCGKVDGDPGGCSDGCPCAPTLRAFERAVLVSGAREYDPIWSPGFYQIPYEGPTNFVPED